VRSWVGTAFAALALTLGAAAMPVAVIHHPLLGATLAGLGVFLGAFGLLIAIKRRGVGCGLSLAGTAVCGSVLFTAIMLLVMSTSPNDHSDSVLDRLFRSKGTPPDQEMMRYLPNNSQFVLSIRIESIVKSQVERNLSQMWPDDIRKQRTVFEETSGLPFDEITHMMIYGVSSNLDAWICVVRTKNPVRITDMFANMKDAKYHEEKVGKYMLYVKPVVRGLRDFLGNGIADKEQSFCVVEKNLVVFGPHTSIQQTLLRDGPAELSTGLKTAIRETDFSKDIACATNAKDLLRKLPSIPQAAEAIIHADATIAAEVDYNKGVEWRVKIMCKDAATAQEIKQLLEKTAADAKADPKTPKVVLAIITPERWSLHQSRIVGTGTIDRETLRQSIEQDNLKLMALAMHSYNDANGHMPAPALYDRTGRPLLSWRVAILPYLGENALYQQFKLDEPWDGPNNSKLLSRMPKVYECAAAPTPPGETIYRVFVGNGAAFEPGRGLRFPAEFPDGTANTILIRRHRAN
jgi:hypothetical protein